MSMCIMLSQRNYMNESPEQNNNDPKKEQDQVDLELTAEEEELLKKKLEELRKMDPFIYR
jgi:hypothetical protein